MRDVSRNIIRRHGVTLPGKVAAVKLYRYSDANTHTDGLTLAKARKFQRLQNGGTITPMSGLVQFGDIAYELTITDLELIADALAVIEPQDRAAENRAEQLSASFRAMLRPLK